MTNRTALWAILLAGGLLAGGCTKKVQITVANHCDTARPIQVSCPDETFSWGSVSAGGRLTNTLTVKTSDLPAACSINAGTGASQSFTVTEDTPGKWWFHITSDGRLTGPYGKDDVHTETDDRGTVETTVRRRMVVN